MHTNHYQPFAFNADTLGEKPLQSRNDWDGIFQTAIFQLNRNQRVLLLFRLFLVSQFPLRFLGHMLDLNICSRARNAEGSLCTGHAPSSTGATLYFISFRAVESRLGRAITKKEKNW